MNKVLNIILILIAFTILGLSIWVTKVQDNEIQHTKQSEQSTEPTHEERVEVVGESQGNTLEGSQKETNDTRSEEGIQQDEITAYIKEVWGDNVDFGINLAKCESSLNPSAVSPSGKYVGLYQFDEPTFNSNCYGDREEWKDQVNCSYKLFERGEVNRWPSCP